MPKYFVKRTGNHEEKPSAKRTLISTEKDSDLTKTLLQWTAPSRPFRKKDRSYYTTTTILVLLLVFIAFLAQEILLIGVILALGFVTYVLAFVPPEEIVYKISPQGVTTGDHFYLWGDMDSFWFSEKEGHKIIHILTHLHFSSQLMLLLGSQKEETVKNMVAQFLPFREIPPKGLVDSWAESLQKHFPLENPHH